MTITNRTNGTSGRRVPRSKTGTPSHILPVISLFSGSGGLDLGFCNAGFTPVLAMDASAAACLTYEHNHPGTRVLRRDLSELPRNYVLDRLSELASGVKPIGVVGGPPCQAFSQGNGYKRDDDPRALLSKSYASILRQVNNAFNLDFFVFENVLGLKHKRHDEQFKLFKRLFASAGFRIFESELNAYDFGVAQVRRRLFIVGLNQWKFPDVEFKFPAPKGKQGKTVRDLIGDLPKPVFFRQKQISGRFSISPQSLVHGSEIGSLFRWIFRRGRPEGTPVSCPSMG